MTANILSVDLVEGALGESADFMIAAYGKDSLGSADMDTLKPTAFKASAEAQKDKDALIQDLQEMTRVRPANRVCCKKCRHEQCCLMCACRHKGR